MCYPVDRRRDRAAWLVITSTTKGLEQHGRLGFWAVRERRRPGLGARTQAVGRPGIPANRAATTGRRGGDRRPGGRDRGCRRRGGRGEPGVAIRGAARRGAGLA